MEKLVVTKEQAERLRKAGWTKGTACYWWCPTSLSDWHIVPFCPDTNNPLPAPTIGELIEVTGCTFIYRGTDSTWTTKKVFSSVEGNADSIMESLVRLFESQNESQREVG